MKINTELADGVVIYTKDFELVKAVRRPNADTKIIQQFYFKGKAKTFQKNAVQK